MDSPTGTHPCISEAIPFISLWAPVGVSAVPEISGVPQKSDFQGDKTHREATWPTKKVFFIYSLSQSYTAYSTKAYFQDDWWQCNNRKHIQETTDLHIKRGDCILIAVEMYCGNCREIFLGCDSK